MTSMCGVKRIRYWRAVREVKRLAKNTDEERCSRWAQKVRVDYELWRKGLHDAGVLDIILSKFADAYATASMGYAQSTLAPPPLPRKSA